MTVDTGNSVKTIADLKKEISELKKALDQEAVGSEGAKKASDELANAQNLLKQAMKGSTDTINVATGSYKDLERQCEQLKLTYKLMADGIEKNNIAKQIAKIQENLKKQDEAIGDFKRNVGDYANAFGSALSSMGSKGGAAFTSLANGTKGVKSGFDLLKAHPIFAVIAAFVLVIQGLVKAFKKNEESVNKLKVAFAPFQGIVNALQTAIGKLVDVIANGLSKAFSGVAKVASKTFELLEKGARALGLDKLADQMAKVNERMTESTEIAKEEVAIQQKSRDVRRQNAEAQVQITKLQREYKQAVGDTAKQAEIAKKIEEENNAIKKRNYDLAKREYDLAVKRDKQAPNSTEENEATVAAYEKMAQAEAALYEVSSEQTKAWKAEAKELKENTKELEANEKARKKELETIQKTLATWAASEGDTTLPLKQLKKEFEESEKVFFEALQNGEITMEEYNLLVQKWLSDNAKVIDQATKLQQTKANQKIDQEISTATNTEQIVNNLTKAEQLRNLKVYELNKAQEEEEFAHQQALLDIQMQGAEDRKKVLEGIVNDVIFFNQLSEDEQKRYIQDLANVNQQIALIDSQRTLLEAQETQKRIETRKKERTMTVNVSLDMADAVADIFGSIADTMDENNKEQFEAAKAFNIASATINTITGAISAYMGAVGNTGINSIPMVGPAIAMALGITNAAAVTAAGIANIVKLSQQQYNSKGSGSNANTSFNASSSAINAINAPVQYTQDVQGASLEDTISTQRVYVSETDIQNVGNKVSVQETENRY